jgi:hypothetical protein
VGSTTVTRTDLALTEGSMAVRRSIRVPLIQDQGVFLGRLLASPLPAAPLVVVRMLVVRTSANLLVGTAARAVIR